MFRHLPESTSLDRLKKLAKERLRTMRDVEPSAALWQAQQAIAREYGFTAWPLLKAHVQIRRPIEHGSATNAELLALEGPVCRGALGGGSSWVCHAVPCTERVRQSFVISRWAADRCRALAIEPSHVLLGVLHPATDAALRQSGDLLDWLFGRAGVSREAVWCDLERRLCERFFAVPADTRATPARPTDLFGTKIPLRAVPFSSCTARVLDVAAQEARGLKHPTVGSPHLLLGLLRLRDSDAGAALRANGLRPATVRRHIARLLG